jgi:hypothetical protein
MIQKKIVEITEQFAIIEARIYLDKSDSEDNFISNALVYQQLNSETKDLKEAEDTAVGYALDDAGFGLAFAIAGNYTSSKAKAATTAAPVSESAAVATATKTSVNESVAEVTVAEETAPETSEIKVVKKVFQYEY